MPKLPCDLDVLIVDEMGKNISGTGMDAKVVNRGPACEYNPYAELPSVTRLFVRDLDPESYGNALGIGMADVTTDRLVAAIDWAPTRVNALSSGIPSKIRVPTHFASDRECLEWVSGTAGRVDPAAVTYGWIRNTLELGRVAVSANLRGALPPDATIEREFTANGAATGISRCFAEESHGPGPVGADTAGHPRSAAGRNLAAFRAAGFASARVRERRTGKRQRSPACQRRSR